MNGLHFDTGNASVKIRLLGVFNLLILKKGNLAISE